MAVLGGKIYVLGGEEGWDHYHDTIECYDPVVDKWELVGEMGSSRSWLSCVGKQKKAFFSGFGILSKIKIRDLFKLVLFGSFFFINGILIYVGIFCIYFLGFFTS